MIKYRVWDGNTREMRVSPDELIHLGSWFDANYNITTEKRENIYFMRSTLIFDANGAEIYEGDICIDPVFWDEKREMRFNICSGICSINATGSHSFCTYSQRSIEIIGNIYEGIKS